MPWLVPYRYCLISNIDSAVPFLANPLAFACRNVSPLFSAADRFAFKSRELWPRAQRSQHLFPSRGTSFPTGQDLWIWMRDYIPDVKTRSTNKCFGDINALMEGSYVHFITITYDVRQTVNKIMVYCTTPSRRLGFAMNVSKYFVPLSGMN